MRHDGCLELAAKLCNQFAFIPQRRIGQWRSPVAAHLHVAPGAPEQEMTSGKLAHAFEDAHRVGYVTEREVLHDRARRDAQGGAIESVQRTQLRAINNAVTVESVAERLHAGAVTRKKETLPTGVPDREGKHPVQVAHHLRAVALVKVYEHFGVAARRETVSRGQELPAQLMVIVDLAVEDDRDGAVLVGDRLVATGDVDDAQAPHAHGDAVADEIAV